MRELELHPPAEEWNRRCVPYSPWSTTNIQDNLESVQEEDQTPFGLWPRKRRYAERDAALGLRTAIGLGSYSAFLGSRRDVVTGVWKTAHHAIWHKVSLINLSAEVFFGTGRYGISEFLNDDLFLPFLSKIAFLCVVLAMWETDSLSYSANFGFWGFSSPSDFQSRGVVDSTVDVWLSNVWWTVGKDDVVLQKRTR